jgi:DNA-binding NarL/FixJ family response regulator
VILISSGWQAQGGLDLARVFAEIAPSKPVLLAVASSIDINVNALAEAGISEILPWPLATTELASALQRCLRGRGGLQP